MENTFITILKYSRFAFLPFSLVAIASGQLLAGNFDMIHLFLTSFSFIFLHIFISGSNFLNDVDSDRVSVLMNRQNPILTGDISKKNAKIINFTAPMLAIITSLFAGSYWVLLILIGIGVIYIYDAEPFRLKDTLLLGLFLPPLNAAGPFLFGYINATSSFSIPYVVVLVLVFYYLNGLTAIRHIPDADADRKMKVRTLTTVYGVDATRYFEIIISISTILFFVMLVFFTDLSIVGLPILIISTIVRLNLLIKPATQIKEPAMWLTSPKMMSTNMIAMLVSIVGTVFLLP